MLPDCTCSAVDGIGSCSDINGALVSWFEARLSLFNCLKKLCSELIEVFRLLSSFCEVSNSDTAGAEFI